MTSPPDPVPAADFAGQRLDTWLDVACLFKTRSAAARACDGGKVSVNGVRGKPHRRIRAGDLLEITLDRGRRRIVRVRELQEAQVPKARARELYGDETPPPTPEKIEARRIERMLREPASARPEARERRALRRLKGRE
jgi:ribosome-associated heat shock protein Hsp15